MVQIKAWNVDVTKPTNYVQNYIEGQRETRLKKNQQQQKNQNKQKNTHNQNSFGTSPPKSDVIC